MRLPENVRTAVTLVRLAGITRICFGTAFIVAPHASARPWVGAAADSAGAQLLTRSMGIRDLLLGVGLLQALAGIAGGSLFRGLVPSGRPGTAHRHPQVA